MGLAVIEAMMLGMPVVALATTEIATVIRDGENGIAHTDVRYLMQRMERLLRDPAHARTLGEAGRKTAQARFSIERFVADWNATFAQALAP